MLFQMLLAYCHLLLFVAALISHLHVTPVSGIAAGTNPGVRQTIRYDPDVDSLGPPYDLHAVGSGNHDDTLMTSQQHDTGCEDAIPPSQVPNDQPAVLVTANDLYQSADSI